MAAKEALAKLVRMVPVQAMKDVLEQADWPFIPDHLWWMFGFVKQWYIWDVQRLWQVALLQFEL